MRVGEKVAFAIWQSGPFVRLDHKNAHLLLPNDAMQYNTIAHNNQGIPKLTIFLLHSKRLTQAIVAELGSRQSKQSEPKAFNFDFQAAWCNPDIINNWRMLSFA